MLVFRKYFIDLIDYENQLAPHIRQQSTINASHSPVIKFSRQKLGRYPRFTEIRHSAQTSCSSPLLSPSRAGTFQIYMYSAHRGSPSFNRRAPRIFRNSAAFALTEKCAFIARSRARSLLLSVLIAFARTRFSLRLRCPGGRPAAGDCASALIVKRRNADAGVWVQFLCSLAKLNNSRGLCVNFEIDGPLHATVDYN